MQLLCLAEKWHHILHFKYLLMRWFITKIKRLEYGSTTSSLCWCRDSKNVLPGERVLCWLMLTDNTTFIKCWQQYFYNYMFANMQSHLTAWSANCYENRARITTFHSRDRVGAPEECSPLSKTGQTESKVNINGSHSPYISALCLPSDLDRTLA